MKFGVLIVKIIWQNKRRDWIIFWEKQYCWVLQSARKRNFNVMLCRINLLISVEYLGHFRALSHAFKWRSWAVELNYNLKRVDEAIDFKRDWLLKWLHFERSFLIWSKMPDDNQSVIDVRRVILLEALGYFWWVYFQSLEGFFVIY